MPYSVYIDREQKGINLMNVQEAARLYINYLKGRREQGEVLDHDIHGDSPQHFKPARRSPISALFASLRRRLVNATPKVGQPPHANPTPPSDRNVLGQGELR